MSRLASGPGPGEPAEVVPPSREDEVVAAASEVVGGPLTPRARPSRRWWTPVRVLLVLTFVACGLGLLQKAPCREAGWTSPGVYSHACYSDIPPLYGGRGLADGEVPFISQPNEHRVEYPVLTGAVMWVTAQFVPDDSPVRARWFFDINAIGLALCAAVIVVATARTTRGRPWDASMVALAPGLILAGTINWDLYAVALLSVGMLAWARRRPGLAGVLIGLSAAAKFYPLLAFGPLLLLCLRAGRLREFRVAAVSAAAAWLAVNLPVMVADFDGWSYFFSFNRERGESWGSPWVVLTQQGHGVPPEKLNTLAGGLFVLCCVAIAALGLMARRRPRLPQLMFLVVAAFLLTNKVYSPQYVLWLLPLAVLARPRWRDFLIWQACEALHYLGTWLFLLGTTNQDVTANRSMSEELYGLLVLLHIVGTLWFAGLVVRDVLRPDLDPVRADGSDDPAGGVLDGADDVVRLGV